jgi:hypothetical protein
LAFCFIKEVNKQKIKNMKSHIKECLNGINKQTIGRKISSGLAIAFVLGSLTFSSCKKKEEKPVEEEDTEETTAVDNNLAESSVSDIESIGSQVSESGSMAFRPSGPSEITLELSPSATVTIVGKVITVDFGTVGIIGRDGRTRTGKLIFDFSASSPASAIYYRNPGFTMNVSSQNYVVDGYQVNVLNKTVTNTTPNTIPQGVNPGTNLTWAITANVSIVKPNNTGTITWSCARTKELINTNDSNCYKGQNHIIVWNLAKIRLSGNASGTNAKGEHYTVVANSLIRDMQCSPEVNHPMRHPFESGTISYSPGSRKTRLIDFGNGTCDLYATVTINGHTKQITLP